MILSLLRRYHSGLTVTVLLGLLPIAILDAVLDFSSASAPLELNTCQLLNPKKFCTGQPRICDVELPTK